MFLALMKPNETKNWRDFVILNSLTPLSIIVLTFLKHSDCNSELDKINKNFHVPIERASARAYRVESM